MIDRSSREERSKTVLGEERTAGGEKEMEIFVKSLPEANLVIDNYVFPAGEKREYRHHSIS